MSEDSDAPDTTGSERGHGEGDDSFERPIDRFRKSATGSVLAAGLLGLRDALEGRRSEEVAIVASAPDQPGDDPIRVELDFDDIGSSRVVIRRAPEN